MTQKQHPLGSGFTAASTTDDVIAGIDLVRPQRRRHRRTRRARSGDHPRAEQSRRDRHRSASATRTAPPRHWRGSSASRSTGWTSSTRRRSTRSSPGTATPAGRCTSWSTTRASWAGRCVRDARGYEAQFATNHLGHFQLTLGLLPALQAAAGARVVEVSSWGHHLSDIRWDDPHFETGYDGMVAYGQAKTANVLFAVELDRRWAGDGIRGYSLHPGPDRRHQPGPMARRARTARDGPHRRRRSADHRPGPRHEDRRAGRQHQRVRGDQSAARRHRRGVPQGQRRRSPRRHAPSPPTPTSPRARCPPTPESRRTRSTRIRRGACGSSASN